MEKAGSYLMHSCSLGLPGHSQPWPHPDSLSETHFYTEQSGQRQLGYSAISLVSEPLDWKEPAACSEKSSRGNHAGLVGIMNLAVSLGASLERPACSHRTPRAHLLGST